MRKFLIVLMAVAMVTFLFVGCIPVKNQAPIITSDPVKTATVGVEYTYDVNAIDPEDDVLTYSLTTKPTGMTINSATGVIKWTPTTKGDYAVIVKVYDGDLYITQSFTIVVSELEPEPEPELVLIGITVDPKTMELFVGEEKNITSVTACYDFRSYGVILDFEDCLFLTSNSKVATVEKVELTTVTVTAKGVGTADILVSYKGKADTLKVTVTYLPMEMKVDMPLFEATVKEGFRVEIVANDDKGKNVLVYFTLPTLPNIDYELEFYGVPLEGVAEGWHPLVSGAEVVFGCPSSGFELIDDTVFFRATFTKAGTYSTTAEVWTVTDGEKDELLCSKVITAVVLTAPPPES